MKNHISKIHDLDERSEQVRDVLGQAPSWPIRWGTTLIFIILGVLLFLAWMIKYPDTILGQVQITTTQPPIRLVAPSEGQIQTLFVEDGARVEQGNYLAEVRNPVGSTTIQTIREILTTTRDFLAEPTAEFRLPQQEVTLGTAQPLFNSLLKDVRDYQEFLDDNYYREQIRALNRQIRNYDALSDLATNQQAITRDDLAQAEERFAAQQELLAAGLISRMEFLQEESNYNAVKIAYEGIQKEALQNNISIYGNRRQIEQLEFDYRDRERTYQMNIQQSLLSLQNHIQSWEETNVFVAPISGKVNFLKRLSENQFVQAQEEVFAIVPRDTNYLAVVTIPVTGYGKMAIGQPVQIRLDNYPEMQFGKLSGRVRKLSAVPNQNAYFAEVELDQGLLTSYNLHLDYHPEMTGFAEIITEDLSLMERIFYKIKEIFDR
jgi:multidrug resistance efflux pump